MIIHYQHKTQNYILQMLHGYLFFMQYLYNHYALNSAPIIPKRYFLYILDVKSCSPYEDSTWTALLLCWGTLEMGAVDELSDYNPVLIAGFNQRRLHPFYCVQKATFTAPKWIWFVTPFDWEIWVLLATSLVLFGLIRQSVRAAFEILFYFFYEPIRQIDRCGMYTLPSLIFISFLSYHYESFITTDITAPLHILIYKTTKDLELAGYKMVIPNLGSFPLGAFLVGKQYKKIMGKEITTDDILVDHEINIYFSTLKYAWFDRIATYQGYIHIQDEIFTKLGKAEVKVRTDKVSCFVTEEVFENLSTRLLVYGPLAGAKLVNRILVSHGESWIWNRWINMKWTDFVRRLNKERFQVDYVEESQRVQGLKLSESIGLIFIVHAVVLCVAIIIYLGEDYGRIVGMLVHFLGRGKELMVKLWPNLKYRMILKLGDLVVPFQTK